MEELTLLQKLGITAPDSLRSSDKTSWLPWEKQSGADVQSFIKRRLAECVIDVTLSADGSGAVFHKHSGKTITLPFSEVHTTYDINTENCSLSSTDVSSFSLPIFKFDTLVKSSTQTGANIIEKDIEIGAKSEVLVALYDSAFQNEAVDNFDSAFKISVPLSATTKVNLSALLLHESKETAKTYILLYLIKKINGNEEINSEVMIATTSEGSNLKLNLQNYQSSYAFSDNVIKIKTNNDASSVQYYITKVGNNSATLLTIPISVGNCQIDVVNGLKLDDGTYTFAYRLINSTNTIYSAWVYKIIVIGAGGIYLEDLGNYEVNQGEYSKLCAVHNSEGFTGDYKIYMYVNSADININSTNYKQNVYNVSEFSFDASSPEGSTDQFIYIKNNINSLQALFYIEDLNDSTKSFLWKQLSGLRNTSLPAKTVNPLAVFEITCNPITNSIYSKYIIPQYDTTLSTDFETTFAKANPSGTDGFVYKDKRVYFKASPSSSNLFSGEGLSFNKLFLNNFSATITFRTENINDLNKPVFNIGNLTFYPGFARINAVSPNLDNDSDLYYYSQADYKYDYDSDSEKTNIIITYQKDYMPSTYDYNFIYSDMYERKNMGSGNLKATYDCLKIYVNGTINRVIPIWGSELGLPNLLVNPQNAVLKVYDFKVWENKVLSYEEIVAERLNAFDYITEKLDYIKNNLIFYSSTDVSSGNNAIDDLLGRISLNKCLGKKVFASLGSSLSTNKKNVLLFVLGNSEKGLARPLNFNYAKDEIGTSILIKYKDEEDRDYDLNYSGLICSSGAKSSKDLHKAQGSSAKKYAGAYNDLYSDFLFTSEAETTNPTGTGYYDYSLKTTSVGKAETDLTADDYEVDTSKIITTKPKIKVWDSSENTSKDIEVDGAESFAIPNKTSYYKMKGEDYQIEKLVGKVNIASSQQSHKLGCCKLYNDAYKNYVNSEITYRKAVHEEPFYYFYIKLSDINAGKTGSDVKTLTDVSWEDITDEVALKAQFFGMITWGSAKADKKTFDFDKKKNVIFEGADNENSCTNFKVPWAALQIWNVSAVVADSGNYSKFKDLPIWKNDDTFEFNGKHYVKPDSKYLKLYTKSGTRSYTDNLLVFDDTIMFRYLYKDENDVNASPDSWDISGGTEDNPTNTTIKKFTPTGEAIVTDFAKFYDLIYLFDFANLELLPTDLYGNTVVTTNLDITKKYIMPLSNRTVNINGIDLQLNTGDLIRYDLLTSSWVYGGLEYTAAGWEKLNVVSIVNDLYNHVYGPNNPFNYITFKLDLSKLDEIEGTYTHINQISTSLGLTNAVELHDIRQAFSVVFKQILDAYFVNGVKEIAFHLAMMRLLNGTDNRAKNTYYISRAVESDYTKYKFEMFQDDLDTIAKTDNNGQQTKSYDLMEPPFNKKTKNRWGDQWSGLFTNVDLVLQEEIQDALSSIIKYYSEHSGVLTSVAKYFPSIAYNHTSEIYYEVPELLMHNNVSTAFANNLQNFKEGKFNNNGVANPASLSHGSCLECEELFYKDRITLLASYCGHPEYLYKGSITVTTSTGSGVTDATKFAIENLSYNINLYPELLGVRIDAKAFEDLKYIEPIEAVGLENLYSTYTSQLAIVSDDKYKIDVKTGASLTGATGFMYNTDAIKTIKISGDVKFDSYNFKNVGEFEINRTISDVYSQGNVDFNQILPSVKKIRLNLLEFPGDVVSFKDCDHLTELVLNNCKFNTLILPNTNKLLVLSINNCTIDLLIIPTNYPNVEFTNTSAEISSISIAATNTDEFISNVIQMSKSYNSIELIKLENNRVISKSLAQLLLEYLEVKFVGGNKVVFNDIDWNIKCKLYSNEEPQLTISRVTITGETPFTTGDLTAVNLLTVSKKDASLGVIPNYGITITNTGNITPNMITYSYSGLDFSLDSSTGKITYSGTDDIQSKTIDILVNKVKQASVIITIGTRYPAVGDFVYDDLTFSEFYNPEKNVVGLIYFTDKNAKLYKMISATKSLSYPVFFLKPNNYVHTRKLMSDSTAISDALPDIEVSSGNSIDAQIEVIALKLGYLNNIIETALSPTHDDENSTIIDFLYALCPLYQYAKKISTEKIKWDMLTEDEWFIIIDWICACNGVGNRTGYTRRSYTNGSLLFAMQQLINKTDLRLFLYFRLNEMSYTINRPKDGTILVNSSGIPETNTFGLLYTSTNGAVSFTYSPYNFNSMNRYQTYYTSTQTWK